MKKVLLSVFLLGAVLVGNAQVALNELYVEPKPPKQGDPGTNEFFELYYSGGLLVGESVDCWTMVTYWTSGANKGVYVMDLPAGVLNPPDRFFVGASSNPFTAQGSPNKVPDFNWNDPSFRNGSTGGYLKKYQVDPAGIGWLDKTADIPAQFNDFMPGGNGEQYVVLIFVNGVFNNGFIGGQSSSALSATIQGMPDLSVTMEGTCSAVPFVIDFSSLGAMETVNAQSGSDNGFIRSSDGKCGSWEKSSSSAEHTPGITNGSATAATGSLTTAQLITCDVPRTVTARVIGVTGNATEADDFPVEITVYNDVNANGILDPADGGAIAPTYFQATLASPGATVPMTSSGANVLISYRTARGCFDKVFNLLNECIALPVKFKSFNAVRSNTSSVSVTWTTASEQNSKGFNIQRNVNGEWKTIAYVPSQALDGNSSSDLNYSFVDGNSEKGITQYRIQQVDLDGKVGYTDIRAIRGDGNLAKVVVYPNPSTDGKVNIVFEDNSSLRDIIVNDMQGKVIRSFRGVSNNILVIEKLTTGFYTIKVSNRTTNASSVHKVVIK